jgi:hypothetical protein
MAELRGGTTIGGYAALHSGLKEAYLGGNLTINGKSNLVGLTTLGTERESVVIASEKTRMIIYPPYHTGGPWNVKARDDSSYAYLEFQYGSSTPALTIRNNGLVQIAGNTVWHSGNDGSGSGLDADLLDGLNSASFIRSDTNNTANITFTNTATAPASSTPTALSHGQLQSYSNLSLLADTDGGTNEYVHISSGYASGATANGLSIGYNSLTWKGSTVWHAANDGSGSGLDADLVDGLHASSFVRSDTGDSIAGNHEFYGTDTAGTYSNAPIELREVNLVTSSQSADGYAPHMSWHWGGRMQVKMFLASDGYLYLNGSKYTKGRLLTTEDVGSGNAMDADKVDGLHASSFMRADADDTFSGKHISSSRDGGIYGTYDSYKTDHIWSMGTAYKNASDGSTFGNIYGMAYKHTNNTTGGSMAGGHQIVFCNAGTPGVAIGLGGSIWAKGSIMADGSLTLGGGITASGNISMGNNMLIAYDGGTSNYDAIWHDDGSNEWHFISDNTAKAVGNSGLVAGYLNVRNTSDASPTSTVNGIIVGHPTSGDSVKIDTNEISSFMNSAVSDLHLNPDGGTVTVGNSSGGTLFVSGNAQLQTDAYGAGTSAWYQNGTSSVRVYPKSSKTAGPGSYPMNIEVYYNGTYYDLYHDAIGANKISSAGYSRNATGSGSWYAVWMNAGREFMRNTSSIRFKENVRPWNAADAVLKLEPVIFDRKGDDTPNDEVGFIAEEVLKHIPDAIQWFEGEVDGIYDRPLIAAIVSLCQRQQKEIDNLEEKVNFLYEKLKKR